MTTHDMLTTISGYEGIFPTIAHKLFNNQIIAQKMTLLLNFAIGSSALGGAYGILFANSWNLFTLAEQNHLIGSKLITSMNRHNTPWVAVLCESFICAIFLWCNQGSFTSLRTTATLGIIIAYTVSAFAYYQLLQRNHASHKDFFVARAAFVTCMLFVASCALNFFKTGLMPLALFVAILIAGIAMYTYKKSSQQA